MGGINFPPMEEAVSMVAALSLEIPAWIILGIVAEPVVAAFAAPLPLTVATPMEPSTALWGSMYRDLAPILLAPLSRESIHPKACRTLNTRIKEPISVSAS